MPAYIELEIKIARTLHPPEPDRQIVALTGDYTVTLALDRPDDPARITDVSGRAAFDLVALREVDPDPDEYGRRLTDSLFADREVRDRFRLAEHFAKITDRLLRVLLFVDSSAPELHAVRWEWLQLPPLSESAPGEPIAGGAPRGLLAMHQQILFSRLISTTDLRPIHQRADWDQRALVAVANPTDHAKYGLDKIDAPAVLRMARQALEEQPPDSPRLDRTFAITPLGGDADPVTASRLFEKLQEGYDILYLVCHGSWERPPGENTPDAQRETLLWLEDDQRNVARLSGSEFAQRLDALPRRPRLILLGTCYSAYMEPSGGYGGFLTAVGPRLAAAGVAAVVAMQHPIGMDTAGQFVQAFFRALREDGQIDRAVAAARSRIEDPYERALPALFMRLKSGQIHWYLPEFISDIATEGIWNSLLISLKEKTCTPILGWELIEPLVGSLDELARDLTTAAKVPLVKQSSEDLPQVTQCLLTLNSEEYVRVQLRDRIRHRIWAHYQPRLKGLPAAEADCDLAQLLSRAGTHWRESDPNNPYLILAELHAPVYLVANSDPLLEDALSALPMPLNESRRSQIQQGWEEAMRQFREAADRLGQAAAFAQTAQARSEAVDLIEQLRAAFGEGNAIQFETRDWEETHRRLETELTRAKGNQNRLLQLLEQWRDSSSAGLSAEDAGPIVARLRASVLSADEGSRALRSALASLHTRPRRELYRWPSPPEVDWPASVFYADLDQPERSALAGEEMRASYKPSADQPLVYHFFGHAAHAGTVPVTEDNYFDYMLALHRPQYPVPDPVKGALTRASLLFLGFDLDDWHFRVLFRYLMSLPGKEALGIRRHVAVQVDPRRSRIADVERAREYFRQYLRKADIDIYRGTADDFLRELRRRWSP